MTKLLYIPTGDFVLFLSSTDYDKSHPEELSQCVSNFYDSFRYTRFTIEEIILGLCDEPISIGETGSWILAKNSFLIVPLHPNEFEIIHD